MYGKQEYGAATMSTELPMPKGKTAYPTADGPSPIAAQLARLDAVTCQVNEFLEKLDQRLAPISVSVPSQNGLKEDTVTLSPVAGTISQCCYRVDAAIIRIAAIMDSLQI